MSTVETRGDLYLVKRALRALRRPHTASPSVSFTQRSTAALTRPNSLPTEWLNSSTQSITSPCSWRRGRKRSVSSNRPKPGRERWIHVFSGVSPKVQHWSGWGGELPPGLHTAADKVCTGHTARRPAHSPSADYSRLETKTGTEHWEPWLHISAASKAKTWRCTDLSAAAWQPPGCVQRWTWCYGAPAGCRGAAPGLLAPRPCSNTQVWMGPWPPEFGSATLSPPHTGS